MFTDFLIALLLPVVIFLGVLGLIALALWSFDRLHAFLLKQFRS